MRNSTQPTHIEDYDYFSRSERARQRDSSQRPPKEETIPAQPTPMEDYNHFGVFENVEQRY